MKINKSSKILILSLILSIFCNFQDLSFAKTIKITPKTIENSQNTNTSKTKTPKSKKTTKPKKTTKTKKTKKKATVKKAKPKSTPSIKSKLITKKEPQKTQNNHEKNWSIYSMIIIVLLALSYILHKTFGLHRIINYLRHIGSG